MFLEFQPLLLQSSHPEKIQTTHGQGHVVCVSIPHGQVHKRPAQTPGTPKAPWPCSRPGRGWPPGGRRPGSADGRLDTKQSQGVKQIRHSIVSCVLCNPHPAQKIMSNSHYSNINNLYRLQNN